MGFVNCRIRLWLNRYFTAVFDRFMLWQSSTVTNESFALDRVAAYSTLLTPPHLLLHMCYEFRKLKWESTGQSSRWKKTRSTALIETKAEKCCTRDWMCPGVLLQNPRYCGVSEIPMGARDLFKPNSTRLICRALQKSSYRLSRNVPSSHFCLLHKNAGSHQRLGSGWQAWPEGRTLEMNAKRIGNIIHHL